MFDSFSVNELEFCKQACREGVGDVKSVITEILS